MTVFVAFVLFDNYRGGEPHTSVAEQVGVVDNVPIYKINGVVRSLHSFEKVFETLAEAKRWCAGELDAYAQETSRRASVLLYEAMQEDKQHGIV